MTVDVETVPASMTLHGAAAFLASPQARHPSFPVVDEAGRVLGVIDPPSVLRWRRAGTHRKTTLAELLAGSKIMTAAPDEHLDALADRLSSANIAHLPVIAPEDGRLVGYIGWKDLMRVRAKHRAEETSRTTFFPITRPLRRLAPRS
jgi:CBS-domain-containing membrane protein